MYAFCVTTHLLQGNRQNLFNIGKGFESHVPISIIESLEAALSLSHFFPSIEAMSLENSQAQLSNSPLSLSQVHPDREDYQGRLKC